MSRRTSTSSDLGPTATTTRGSYRVDNNSPSPVTARKRGGTVVSRRSSNGGGGGGGTSTIPIISETILPSGTGPPATITITPTGSSTTTTAAAATSSSPSSHHTRMAVKDDAGLQSRQFLSPDIGYGYHHPHHYHGGSLGPGGQGMPGGTNLERVPSINRLQPQSSTETSGLGETITSGFSSQESVHSAAGNYNVSTTPTGDAAGDGGGDDYYYYSYSGGGGGGGGGVASDRHSLSPSSFLHPNFHPGSPSTSPSHPSSTRSYRGGGRDTGGRSLSPQEARLLVSSGGRYHYHHHHPPHHHHASPPRGTPTHSRRSSPRGGGERGERGGGDRSTVQQHQPNPHHHHHERSRRGSREYGDGGSGDSRRGSVTSLAADTKVKGGGGGSGGGGIPASTATSATATSGAPPSSSSSSAAAVVTVVVVGGGNSNSSGAGGGGGGTGESFDASDSLRTSTCGVSATGSGSCHGRERRDSNERRERGRGGGERDGRRGGGGGGGAGYEGGVVSLSGTPASAPGAGLRGTHDAIDRSGGVGGNSGGGGGGGGGGGSGNSARAAAGVAGSVTAEFADIDRAAQRASGGSVACSSSSGGGSSRPRHGASLLGDSGGGRNASLVLTRTDNNNNNGSSLDGGGSHHHHHPHNHHHHHYHHHHSKESFSPECKFSNSNSPPGRDREKERDRDRVGEEGSEFRNGSKNSSSSSSSRRGDKEKGGGGSTRSSPKDKNFPPSRTSSRDSVVRSPEKSLSRDSSRDGASNGRKRRDSSSSKRDSPPVAATKDHNPHRQHHHHRHSSPDNDADLYNSKTSGGRDFKTVVSGSGSSDVPDARDRHRSRGESGPRRSPDKQQPQHQHQSRDGAARGGRLLERHLSQDSGNGKSFDAQSPTENHHQPQNPRTDEDGGDVIREQSPSVHRGPATRSRTLDGPGSLEARRGEHPKPLQKHSSADSALSRTGRRISRERTLERQISVDVHSPSDLDDKRGSGGVGNPHRQPSRESAADRGGEARSDPRRKLVRESSSDRHAGDGSHRTLGNPLRQASRERTLDRQTSVDDGGRKGNPTRNPQVPRERNPDKQSSPDQEAKANPRRTLSRERTLDDEDRRRSVGFADAARDSSQVRSSSDRSAVSPTRREETRAGTRRENLSAQRSRDSGRHERKRGSVEEIQLRDFSKDESAKQRYAISTTSAPTASTSFAGNLETDVKAVEHRRSSRDDLQDRRSSKDGDLGSRVVVDDRQRARRDSEERRRGSGVVDSGRPVDHRRQRRDSREESDRHASLEHESDRVKDNPRQRRDSREERDRRGTIDTESDRVIDDRRQRRDGSEQRDRRASVETESDRVKDQHRHRSREEINRRASLESESGRVVDHRRQQRDSREERDRRASVETVSGGSKEDHRRTRRDSAGERPVSVHIESDRGAEDLRRNRRDSAEEERRSHVSRDAEKVRATDDHTRARRDSKEERDKQTLTETAGSRLIDQRRPRRDSTEERDRSVHQRRPRDSTEERGRGGSAETDGSRAAENALRAKRSSTDHRRPSADNDSGRLQEYKRGSAQDRPKGVSGQPDRNSVHEDQRRAARKVDAEERSRRPSVETESDRAADDLRRKRRGSGEERGRPGSVETVDFHRARRDSGRDFRHAENERGRFSREATLDRQLSVDESRRQGEDYDTADSSHAGRIARRSSQQPSVPQRQDKWISQESHPASFREEQGHKVRRDPASPDRKPGRPVTARHFSVDAEVHVSEVSRRSSRSSPLNQAEAENKSLDPHPRTRRDSPSRTRKENPQQHEQPSVEGEALNRTQPEADAGSSASIAAHRHLTDIQRSRHLPPSPTPAQPLPAAKDGLHPAEASAADRPHAKQTQQQTHTHKSKSQGKRSSPDADLKDQSHDSAPNGAAGSVDTGEAGRRADHRSSQSVTHDSPSQEGLQLDGSGRRVVASSKEPLRTHTDKLTSRGDDVVARRRGSSSVDKGSTQRATATIISETAPRVAQRRSNVALREPADKEPTDRDLVPTVAAVVERPSHTGRRLAAASPPRHRRGEGGEEIEGPGGRQGRREGRRTQQEQQPEDNPARARRDSSNVGTRSGEERGTTQDRRHRPEPETRHGRGDAEVGSGRKRSEVRDRSYRASPTETGDRRSRAIDEGSGSVAGTRSGREERKHTERDRRERPGTSNDHVRDRDNSSQRPHRDQGSVERDRRHGRDSRDYKGGERRKVSSTDADIKNHEEEEETKRSPGVITQDEIGETRKRTSERPQGGGTSGRSTGRLLPVIEGGRVVRPRLDGRGEGRVLPAVPTPHSLAKPPGTQPPHLAQRQQQQQQEQQQQQQRPVTMGSDGRQPPGGRQQPPRTIVTVTSPTSPGQSSNNDPQQPHRHRHPLAHHHLSHPNGDVSKRSGSRQHGSPRPPSTTGDEMFDDLFTQAKKSPVPGAGGGGGGIAGLQVDQINHEWERRESRGSLRSNRSRSSHGGSFRSSGGVRRGGRSIFLGVHTESAWTRWSRDRRASFRRRIELLEKPDEPTVARVSTPVRKGRQEGLKFVHPDLEGTFLSEEDLNELRRHKQQKYHTIRVIEKSRKGKFRMNKAEVHLTAEQWQVISDFWDHPVFVRGRYLGLFLMFVSFVVMVISITHNNWVSYEAWNLTIYEGLWIKCSTPILHVEDEDCDFTGGRGFSGGIWHRCYQNLSDPEAAAKCPDKRTQWQNAVIGLMIFAASFGILASVLSICGVCTTPLPRKIYYFHSAGEIFLICALSTGVALMVFPIAIEIDDNISSHRYGIGYGLGWGGAFFFLAAAVCMSLDDLVREASRARCCRWCWKSKQNDRTELRQV